MNRRQFALLALHLLVLVLGTCRASESLDPDGRNVCKLTRRRPYPQDALMPQEWQIKSDDLEEHRCCDGWRQLGDSCSEAVCRDQCQHGYCAAPNFCLCDDGWTGPTCSELCHRLLENGRCLVECDCPSGRCTHPGGECACPPGLAGPNCTELCEPGYHGAGCLLQCQCEANVTCSSDTGLCLQPLNLTVLPMVPGHTQFHLFRLSVLTCCGIVALVAVVSATGYAVRKRRTRRVFNVRKRTMSMTPITGRPTTSRRQEFPINVPSMLHERETAEFQDSSIRFLRSCASTASYIGMADLLEVDDLSIVGAGERPVSCLSTSTTLSTVESISESRDTIYEVRDSQLLKTAAAGGGACQRERSRTRAFLAETGARPWKGPSGVSGGSLLRRSMVSDTDSEEYNYPYADLVGLRLPAAGESTRTDPGIGRALRPCSSSTEYVVVLQQDRSIAHFTPGPPLEPGLTRQRPCGMSARETGPTTPPSSRSPPARLAQSLRGGYLVPRSPPIRRPTDPTPSCEQGFARGYLTSVRQTSVGAATLSRGSERRRARRSRTEIVACPPPPSRGPPRPSRDPPARRSEPPVAAEPDRPMYVNSRTIAQSGRQFFSCTRKAPPIPKPRSQPVAAAPLPRTKSNDVEVMPKSGGPGTERFI